jgi:glucose/arabinose dehydrogenase
MLAFRAPRYTAGLSVICTLLAAVAPIVAGAQESIDGLSVPDGFRAEVYADSLDGPWGLAFGPDSQLYVSLRGAGLILRLADEDGDGFSDSSVTVLDGLGAPTGIAFLGDDLWVVEAGRLTRLIGAIGESPERDTIPASEFPELGIPPTALLLEPSIPAFYLSIGASCDACTVDDPRRGTIIRYATVDEEARVWARGLRHAVGLALNPVSGELWATEIGRRGLGADLPTDEVNAVHPGRDYGWPYCYGVRVPAPEYADTRRCDRSERPAFMFPAGSAPVGVVFYSGDAFPVDYHGDAFVALSGSAGGVAVPRVVRLKVRDGRPSTLESFISGWAVGSRVSGGPVAFAIGPKGSLYVSDELGGRIWRVSYDGTAVSNLP